MIDNWPRAGSDDTYQISDVQERVFRGSPVPITKLTAGQVVPDITRKLRDVAVLSDNSTRVGSVQLIRSNNWFTLLDSQVNDNGEIVYQVKTAGPKKTPSGRIVRIRINYEFGPGGFQNEDFCYQIV